MIRAIVKNIVNPIVGQLILRLKASVALWFDDGSGAINNPWDDSDIWSE